LLDNCNFDLLPDFTYDLRDVLFCRKYSTKQGPLCLQHGVARIHDQRAASTNTRGPCVVAQARLTFRMSQPTLKRLKLWYMRVFPRASIAYPSHKTLQYNAYTITTLLYKFKAANRHPAHHGHVKRFGVFSSSAYTGHDLNTLLPIIITLQHGLSLRILRFANIGPQVRWMRFRKLEPTNTALRFNAIMVTANSACRTNNHNVLISYPRPFQDASAYPHYERCPKSSAPSRCR
jgi:hypothetical protein